MYKILSTILITLLLNSCTFWYDPWHDNHVHNHNHNNPIHNHNTHQTHNDYDFVCDNGVEVKLNVIHQPYSSNDKICIDVINNSGYTIYNVDIIIGVYFGNCRQYAQYYNIQLNGPLVNGDLLHYDGLYHKYQNYYLHAYILDCDIIY